MSIPYSIGSYRSILEMALAQGYQFISFTDNPAPDKYNIYLRHDIDYSLDMALKVAQLNHQLGISATFFFLVRSPIYNILSDPSTEYVFQISELEQRIALHYTLPSRIIQCKDELIESVLMDFHLLQQQFGQVEHAVSWHTVPQSFIDDNLELEIPGLVNIYSHKLIKNIAYYSDSNLRNSVEKFYDVLAKDKPLLLHLLFHPLNWVAGGSNMIEILAKTWISIIREREQEMLRNKVYGARFPQGMPSQILEAFSIQIMNAELE